MINPRNAPPLFLVECLRANGYETIPLLAAGLGCSISWIRKLVKTKLRGRLNGKPKVIGTGGAEGIACLWVLVEAARGTVGR